jgi:hypothetical protein
MYILKESRISLEKDFTWYKYGEGVEGQECVGINPASPLGFDGFKIPAHGAQAQSFERTLYYKYIKLCLY